LDVGLRRRCVGRWWRRKRGEKKGRGTSDRRNGACRERDGQSIIHSSSSVHPCRIAKSAFVFSSKEEEGPKLISQELKRRRTFNELIADLPKLSLPFPPPPPNVAAQITPNKNTGTKTNGCNLVLVTIKLLNQFPAAPPPPPLFELLRV